MKKILVVSLLLLAGCMSFETQKPVSTMDIIELRHEYWESAYALYSS